MSEKLSKIERQLGNNKLLERYKRFLSFSISPMVNFNRNLRIKLDLEEREIKKEDTERIFNIIYSNNLMAHILNSREYQVILKVRLN